MTQDLSVPAALIAERMGLNFPKDRWPDLVHGLEKAAAGLGFADCDSLMVGLMTGAFGPEQVQALAGYLTIPETHFFRSPETFAMLQNHILPELLSARISTTRSLRIWSAGCATGPEPFSLAILISRLVPDLPDWNISILATDINPAGFDVARRGEYTQWAFRGTPAWVTSGYFTKSHNNRYRISPAVQKMVEFRYLNLIEDDYPTDCDLILCRNVIMYFARETAARVAGKLRESLREGGYLLVTASETGRDIQGSMSSLTLGGEIVYKRTPPERESPAPPPLGSPSAGDAATRKAKVTKPTPAQSKRRRGASPLPQRGALRLERRAYSREDGRAAKPLGTDTPDVAEEALEAAQEARQLANMGRLDQALDRCTAALACDKLNPSLYYLKASILQEMGQPQEAEQALQSTLFLDGDFALARVMLGAIARSQSRGNEAARHFREALALLEQLPSDSVLAETDGLTAGEMVETVASLIESERVS